MCGLGGSRGSGDGGAADREAKRQKKQDAAIGRINLLFGVDPGDEPINLPDKSDEKYLLRDANNPYGKVASPFNQERYDQDVAEDIKNNAIEAEKNKAALNEMYKSVGTDVSEYLTNDLDEQFDNAKRNSRFNVARRGVRGGSSELDIQDRMNKTFDKGVVNINNRASDAENKFRASDNQTRLAMVQRILQGMSGDAAITSAQQSMKDNLRAAKTGALAQSLDNMFGDFAVINNSTARQKGERQASEYYGTYYPSSKSYSGRNS